MLLIWLGNSATTRIKENRCLIIWNSFTPVEDVVSTQGYTARQNNVVSRFVLNVDIGLV